MPTSITGQGISASPKVDATLSNTSKNAVQNQAVANALAGAYDATTTYAVGDLCIHDGILYECTIPIATAEAWDATHWKTRNFGDTVSDLNRHLSDLEDSIGDAYDATASYAVGDFCINENTLYRCNTAIPTGGEAWTPAHWDAVQIVDLLGAGGGDVTDVQIAGTSILRDGVANIPLGTGASPGAVRVSAAYGIAINKDGLIYIIGANQTAQFKALNALYTPVTLGTATTALFYALAKLAGDATLSASDNPVGTYTEGAKSAIHGMLNGAVTVSGTTPTIVAKSGIRYVCGEVATLDFTPSATGICDVVFTSGATATVLTVPSTIKWANGFDPTSLEANTTYEINIMDGIGVAVGVSA